MNRRGFLRSVSALGLVPILPSVAQIAAPAPVDPVTFASARHMARAGRIMTPAQLSRRFGINAGAARNLSMRLAAIGYMAPKAASSPATSMPPNALEPAKGASYPDTMSDRFSMRAPQPDDFDALAELWHAGWHDGHAGHVPDALLQLRTLASFRERVGKKAANIRMVGKADLALGFCAIDGAELDQLFVARAARGTGLAEALLRDGEARMRATGVEEAHLLCLPENTRAARFYEKHGWRDTGIVPSNVETSSGKFELECIVFRKSL